MNFKSLVLALGVVGAVAASGAQANVSVDYHDVTGASVTDTVYQRVAGAFTDYFFFQVISPSMGTGIVSDINAGIFLNIDNLTVEFGSDTGAIGTFDGDVANELVGTGDNIIGQKLLAPGSYFFKITGDVNGWGLNIDGNNANGAELGAYFFSASAAPVPEAETWAMMGLGLGLVGLQLRRRKAAERIA